LEVLPNLRREIEDGKREKFKFVFIDADKKNNLNYLNEAILMCEPRYLIVVDDVVRKGLLADEEMAKSDLRVAGSRQGREARMHAPADGWRKEI
jgi:predicted O-methyltransferase YrrM